MHFKIGRVNDPSESKVANLIKEESRLPQRFCRKISTLELLKDPLPFSCQCYKTLFFFITDAVARKPCIFHSCLIFVSTFDL
jgi:hypothetical protein